MCNQRQSSRMTDELQILKSEIDDTRGAGMAQEVEHMPPFLI